jgi:hypothetical protein
VNWQKLVLKFVKLKSHPVNVFLAGFSYLEPLCATVAVAATASSTSALTARTSSQKGKISSHFPLLPHRQKFANKTPL